MNILIITMDFPPLGGGMSQKAHALATQWAASGVKTFVITPIEGINNSLYERIVIPLNGHYLWQSFRLSGVIKKVVCEKNIDSIFCLSWSPAGLASILSGSHKKSNVGVAVNGFDLLH